MFNNFYVKLDNKPDTWENRIILFVGYLIENERKSSTVKSYISAIKAVLQEDGVVLNMNQCLLTSLTKACRFQNNLVRTRLPIRQELLGLLLQSIPTIVPTSPNEYLVKLYKALLVTAYFGLFRIGELTESPHVVKVSDVHVGVNKDKMMFMLKTSKTHWQDVPPQIVKISREASSGLDARNDNRVLPLCCPFEMLGDYIAVRRRMRMKDEQFFVFRDRSPVTVNHVRSLLKNLLKMHNLKPELYGCHSLCAGRAVDLLKIYKLEISVIKKLGRWRSNAIFSYLTHL